MSTSSLSNTGSHINKTTRRLSHSLCSFFQRATMAEKPTEKKASFSLTDSQINTIAGAASGALVSVLVSPLDVVKTRIQVKRLPKGVPDTPLLVTIYRLAQREGYRAFFKGLGTTMLVSDCSDPHHSMTPRTLFRVTYPIGLFILALTNGRKSSSLPIYLLFSTNTTCSWTYLPQSLPVPSRTPWQHLSGLFVLEWWHKQIMKTTETPSMLPGKSTKQRDFTHCIVVLYPPCGVW